MAVNTTGRFSKFKPDSREQLEKFKNKDVCDGSPIIEGTRTRVIDIAVEYEVLGRSPDEIIRSHPHVNLHLIHDALSFYYENRDELDQKIKQDREFITRLKGKFPSKMV